MAAAVDRRHNRKVQHRHAPIITAGGGILHEIDIRPPVDQFVGNCKLMRFDCNLKGDCPSSFFGGCLATQCTSSGLCAIRCRTSSIFPSLMDLNSFFILLHPASPGFPCRSVPAMLAETRDSGVALHIWCSTQLPQAHLCQLQQLRPIVACPFRHHCIQQHLQNLSDLPALRPDGCQIPAVHRQLL